MVPFRRGLSTGSGQRCTVDFAIWRKRELIEHFDQGGNHMRRQVLRYRSSNLFFVNLTSLTCYEVRNEFRFGRSDLAHHRHGLAHILLLQELSINLTKLNPQATKLDLMIQSPKNDD